MGKQERKMTPINRTTYSPYIYIYIYTHKYVRARARVYTYIRTVFI